MSLRGTDRSRRRWLCALAALGGAALVVGVAGASAQVVARDLNQATRAEIESARGVGVELADRILRARGQGPFEDWGDLRRRVKRVSRRALEGLHEAGFMLGGQLPPLPDGQGQPKKPLTSASRARASA